MGGKHAWVLSEFMPPSTPRGSFKGGIPYPYLVSDVAGMGMHLGLAPNMSVVRIDVENSGSAHVYADGLCGRTPEAW